MTEHAPQAGPERAGLVRVGLSFLTAYGVLPLVLVLMVIAFGLIEPAFASMGNFVNVLKQASFPIILATAQLFALLTRGFDLSVGSAISMISVASALVMMGMLEANPDAVGLAILVACLAGLGIGLVVGVVNGVCVSLLRVNPFVTTLGMQGIALGFAATLSGGFPVFNLPDEFRYMFFLSSWFGIPAPVAVCLIVLATAHVVLNHTVLGRSLYILGGNPRAAHVAGLSSRLHLVCAYVLCSFCVAVGALLLTARTGSGEPSLGGGLMLLSVAAAVIGGVTLRGGEGRIIHCIVGGLFVTILSNGMNMVRVDGYIQQIILGIIIIAAVCIDRLRTQIR